MVCADKEERDKTDVATVKTKVTTEVKRCSEYRFVKTELQQS